MIDEEIMAKMAKQAREDLVRRAGPTIDHAARDMLSSMAEVGRPLVETSQEILKIREEPARNFVYGSIGAILLTIFGDFDQTYIALDKIKKYIIRTEKAHNQFKG